MTRGNILTEEEIARLAALPETKGLRREDLCCPRKEKIHRLHPLALLRPLLLLPRPSREKHHLLASLELPHRRNLVAHRPLPHLRHGRRDQRRNPRNMHRRSQSPLSITQSKESTRYEQRNHQRTGHSPPERPHAPAERIRPYPLLRKRKEEIHSLHPLDRLRRLLLLSRPSCEEHHLLAAMDLLYRRNLVDHRPLPHLRHGRQEE